MKIIFNTTSTDSDFNGGCDYAFVDLAPAFAKFILGQMDSAVRLFRSNSAVHEVHCWDCSARYFGSKLDGKLVDRLEEHLPGTSDSYVLLPARVTVPESRFRRTEYDHLVVAVNSCEPEVYWRATPHGSSVYIETGILPRSLIQKIAAGKRIKPGRY